MQIEGAASVSTLADAFNAWAARLSAAHVVFDGPRLDEINRSTFQHATRLAGAIYPANRSDIAHCLDIARTHSIPLHVVSRGRNWGYGSRLPSRPWAVLMSLERLTRIELDEPLAKVSLEPGVTFGQLEKHLLKSQSAMLPPEIGAGPDTSVLGNALQRGIGKGPYSNMAAQILSLDVILADGSIVKTDAAGAFGEPGQAIVSCSAGPSIAGLFQQSDLGIVLSACVALHRAPQLRQLVLRTIRGDALVAALEAIRPLLQTGDPRLQIELVNGQRAQLQTFGELELAADSIDSEWLVAATLWADDEDELKWRRRSLDRALNFPVSGGCEVPVERREKFARQDWSGLNTAYALLGREPTKGADPDRDGCGLIWVAPEVPFLPGLVARLLPPVGDIIAGFGLIPAVSMRPLDGRDLRLVIALVFDRRKAGEDQRALDCAAAIRDLLAREGFGLYRPGILDQGRGMRDAGSERLLAALTDVLDPRRILAHSYPQGVRV